MTDVYNFNHLYFFYEIENHNFECRYIDMHVPQIRRLTYDLVTHKRNKDV